MPRTNICQHPLRVWLWNGVAHGLLICVWLGSVSSLHAVVLWSDADARVVHHSGHMLITIRFQPVFSKS